MPEWYENDLFDVARKGVVKKVAYTPIIYDASTYLDIEDMEILKNPENMTIENLYKLYVDITLGVRKGDTIGILSNVNSNKITDKVVYILGKENEILAEYYTNYEDYKKSLSENID